jgi:hypothetical protein
LITPKKVNRQESTMKRFGALALASSLLIGCASDGEADAGSGNASFNVWGEDYIEVEIPAEDVEDGWSVKFTRFLIVISDVTVADRAGAVGGRLAGSQLFNLVTPGPHDVGAFNGLTARAWDKVGYTVGAANARTTAHSSAGADDLSAMKSGGFSVLVAGNATNGTVTKTFEWSFTNSTRYDDCVAEIEDKETPGVVVTNGGNESVQLTIHGDHFFYDDLAAEAAVPRFNAMAAADTLGDGKVTFEELTAVKLVDIPEGTYGTGSASHVDDLGAFVQAQTASLGHYRGEGHCTATQL